MRWKPRSPTAGIWIQAQSLRATAATNALDHQADIAKVQEWLGMQILDDADLSSSVNETGGLR